MVEYATLQLHKETKEQLARIRARGESYDATVRRLLETALRAEEDAFLEELERIYEDKDNFEPLA